MCKVADAAKIMINHAIDLAYSTQDPNYYVDYYKLHKLLYYAQGYMLVHYGKHLFVDSIEAHNCGPFIPKLVELKFGCEPIMEKVPEADIRPITLDRVEAIDCVLRHMGNVPKNTLVAKSKGDSVYLKYYQCDAKVEIPMDAMRDEKELFDLE